MDHSSKVVKGLLGGSMGADSKNKSYAHMHELEYHRFVTGPIMAYFIYILMQVNMHTYKLCFSSLLLKQVPVQETEHQRCHVTYSCLYAFL